MKTNKPRKPGRPAIPPEKSRTWISARLSPAAADALHRATYATGLSRSAVIEAALLAYAPLDAHGLPTVPLPLD